jgi:hypothetical protein
LQYLTDIRNRKLFYNLIIASANHETKLNYICEGIPSDQAVNQDYFDDLLKVLTPFMQNNLLNICNMILELFTYENIMGLYEQVHPKLGSYFKFLAKLPSEILDDFVNKFTLLSRYKKPCERGDFFKHICNNVFDCVSQLNNVNQFKRKSLDSSSNEEDNESQKYHKKTR